MSDTPEELQTDQEDDQLVTMWFETESGVRYEMPDMTREDVTLAHESLSEDSTMSAVSVPNVSQAFLLIPRHIVVKAGVGDRCFWEKS